jgi:integrase
MKVFLREKKISKGRKSLYLDFYPPIIHPVTGKPTRREFLDLFVYEKPKGELEREHNKETRIIGDNVKAKRQLEIQAGNYGFFDKSKRKTDFVKYFKELVEKRKTSKGNYDNWLSSYNYFKAFTKGHCLVENLTEKLCNDFREYLLHTPSLQSKKTVKTLSQNAAHSYFNKFRAAVKQAYDDKLIQENPVKHVKAIKAAETHREFLTLDELNKLAKTECDPPVLKRLSLFSALSGMRWSDIVALTWGQVHSETDGSYIEYKQRKTKGVETLPISDQAYHLLGVPGKVDEKIFPGIEYSGWISQKLKLWVLSAGIRKTISFHSFRHTFATGQLSAGTDIYTVSKMLGHKNLKTTQVYAKIIDQKKIDAANKIKLDL